MKRRVLVLAALVVATLAMTTPAPAGAEVDEMWDYRAMAASGSYQAFTGDFGGDDATDIFWYAPGTGADSIWFGKASARGSASLVRKTFSVSGNYTPIVGDFGGDEDDDILWYGAGSTPDYLWISHVGSTTFTSLSRPISGSFTPVPLVDYHDGKDDIYWSGAGPAKDYLWHFDDSGAGTYQNRTVTSTGTYVPVAGDWNGDGYEDLVLYGPGSTPDYKWLSSKGGAFTSSALSISGSYKPFMLWQVPNDGILWWTDGPAAENLWRSNGTTFASYGLGAYDVTANVSRFATGALLFWGPYVHDTIFFDSLTNAGWYELSPSGHELDAQPLIGDFDDDGWSDIAWYGQGSLKDQLWYAQPPEETSARSLPGGLPADTRRVPTR